MSSTSTPVDTYLAALGRSLTGPRRRKADLLAEARDHLTDATEALEADGLDRYDAEREAVADFGDLADVVPGYRAELAISQSRRTAMMLFLALMIQPIVWKNGVWVWNQNPVDPSSLNAFLGEFVRAVGSVAIGGAIVSAVAAGVGMRFAVVREHLSRATAYFTLACAAVIAVTGVGMASTAPSGRALLSYAVVATFVVLPMAAVGLQARRCLRLARS